jgi:hypothetical protein
MSLLVAASLGVAVATLVGKLLSGADLVAKTASVADTLVVAVISVATVSVATLPSDKATALMDGGGRNFLGVFYNNILHGPTGTKKPKNKLKINK